MKRPRSYPSEAFDEMASTMSSGRYRRYDSLSELPSALSRVAGFPAEDNFVTAAVMASNSSEHPPAIAGVAPASSAPIFRVSTIRWDQHGPSGEPHINRDDVLLFRDREGQSWQLFAHDQPGHYTSLSTDARLDAVLDEFRWPRSREGSLDKLKAAGALVAFSTGAGDKGAV